MVLSRVARPRAAVLGLLVLGVLFRPSAGRADDPCLTTVTLPEPVAGAASVYDPVHRYAYLVGGQTWQLRSSVTENGQIDTAAVPRMSDKIYRFQAFRSGTSSFRICMTGPEAMPRPLGYPAIAFVPDDQNSTTAYDSAAYISGGIHCFNVGGGCGTRHSDAIFRYLPGAAAGKEIQEMTKLPLIPGQASGARYASASAFVPILDPSNPQPHENKVYVFGGIKTNDFGITNQVVRYDPVTRSASLIPSDPDLPHPQIALASALYARWTNSADPSDPEDCPEGCVYLFGGFYQMGAELLVTSYAHRFDPASGQIRTVRSRLMTPRYGTNAVWVSGSEHPFTGDAPRTDTFGSGRTLCRFGCAYIIGGRGPLNRDVNAEAGEIGTCSPSPSCTPYSSEPREISWDETLKFDPSLSGANGDVTTTYAVPSSVYPPGRWGSGAVWFPAIRNGFIFGGAARRVDPGAPECYGAPNSCFHRDVKRMFG